MGRYFTNELAFDLPDLAFDDKTVTILEAPTSGDRTLTVIVQRFRMPAGKSLRDVVTDHLSRARTNLPGFSLLHEREHQVAGGAALDVGIRWKGEKSLVYTRNAFLCAGQQWLLIGTNTDFAERSLCDEAFDLVVQSVQLRGT